MNNLKIQSIITLFYVAILFVHNATSQGIIFKLRNEIDERIEFSKAGSEYQITFRNQNLDKIFKNVKISEFRRAYPSAIYFDHPASERVSKYWLMEGEFDLDAKMLSLKEIPEVEDVYKNEVPISTHVPNDFALESIDNQDDLESIRAKEAWNISTGNSQVKIAIVDNGFQTHEDLTNQIVYQEAGATQLHGTTTSGVAAAQTNNNMGISSIGYNSKLMLYIYNNAYDKMMQASLAGAKVINNSYISSCSYQQAQQDIVDMITDNGTLIIGSAGNGNLGASCSIDNYVYPASYDNVLSVSGYNSNTKLYLLNSTGRFTFNDKVDLTAPGWRVTTTTDNNTYLRVSGTSSSAPFVSGTAALVFDTKPCLSPREVAYIIKKSTNKSINNPILYPENAPYINVSGTGMLDAYNAVLSATLYPQIVSDNAFISGPDVICQSNSTFTLNNIPDGFTISWSVTPSNLVVNSLGTITSSNNSASVTLNAVGHPIGEATIKFQLNGICTNNIYFEDTFWVGHPLSVTGTFSGPTSVNTGDLVWYSVPNQTQQDGTFYWTKPRGFDIVTNGNGYRNVRFYIQQTAWNGYVQVWKTNACGNGGAKWKYVTVTDDGGCNFCPITQMSPNPAKDHLNILYLDKTTNTALSEDDFAEQREYVITDFHGNIISTFKSYKTDFDIDLSQINNGLYILTITHGSLGVDQHRFEVYK